jgi:hypothetical protein
MLFWAVSTWFNRMNPVVKTKSFEGNMTFINLSLLRELLVAGDQPLPQKSPKAGEENRERIHPSE